MIACTGATEKKETDSFTNDGFDGGFDGGFEDDGF